jgi:hypothetical protein
MSAFAWNNWGEPPATSVKISSVLEEMENESQPKRSQGHCLLISLFWGILGSNNGPSHDLYTHKIVEQNQ